MSQNGINVDRSSFSFTIVAMQNFRKATVRNATYKAFVAAMDVYEKRAYDAITLTDHTQEDLNELGNPYARRHGKLTLHAGSGGGYIRDGRHQIHRQGGQMARALRRKTTRYPEVKSVLRFDLNAAEHIRKVLEGDELLLPRDPLWEVVQAPKTISEMRQAIVRVLGKELRTQAAIRVGGG